MDPEKYYIINPNFVYMTGHYDRNGKTFTFVRELHRMLIVDRTPIEILADTIRCIGFDLKGAIATAKWILGDIPMCPIVVNPIHNICIFPTKSSKNEDAMWFNPNHIVRTKSVFLKTKVTLRNGLIIIVPSKVSSFNMKLQNADQLRKITEQLRNNPISFLIERKHSKLRNK